MKTPSYELLRKPHERALKIGSSVLFAIDEDKTEKKSAMKWKVTDIATIV